MTLERQGGKAERAEPDSEHHCSPVLRLIDSNGTEWFTEVVLAADGEHCVCACSTDYDRPDGKPESGLDLFMQWIRRNWYDFVASSDFKHYKAGTRVEKLRIVMGAFHYASKAYIGKTEDDLKLENKPVRFWGVIGRANLKFGKREVLEISAKQGYMIRRTIERYQRAKTKPERRKFLRRDLFSAKLYCNADFWVERLLKLISLYGITAVAVPKSGLYRFIKYRNAIMADPNVPNGVLPRQPKC